MVDIVGNWYAMKAAEAVVGVAYEYGKEGYKEDWEYLAGLAIQIGAQTLKSWDTSHKCPSPNQKWDGTVVEPRCSDKKFLMLFSWVYGHILISDIQGVYESEVEGQKKKTGLLSEVLGGRDVEKDREAVLLFLEKRGVYPHKVTDEATVADVENWLRSLGEDKDDMLGG